MSGRVDLDAVEARTKAVAAARATGDLLQLHMDTEEVLALIFELRAAREALTRTYERLSQDGYDPAGPILSRIREVLTQHVQPPPGTKEVRP